jgi:hypothetical protein
MRSKILMHFMKGSISFSLMEMIITMPIKLEYLEGLVKLGRRKKDEQGKHECKLWGNLVSCKRR